MNKRQRSLLILILGLLSAIGPFSIDMYLPGFPDIAKDLHTTVAKVALSLSSFFIGISEESKLRANENSVLCRENREFR